MFLGYGRLDLHFQRFHFVLWPSFGHELELFDLIKDNKDYGISRNI